MIAPSQDRWIAWFSEQRNISGTLIRFPLALQFPQAEEVGAAAAGEAAQAMPILTARHPNPA